MAINQFMEADMVYSKKNGTIELLRFIFCMDILLFHIEKYIFGEPSLKNGIHVAFFPHGAIGVEFFFLLSGCLMAKSIFEIKSRDKNGSLVKNTLTFMKKNI